MISSLLSSTSCTASLIRALESRFLLDFLDVSRSAGLVICIATVGDSNIEGGLVKIFLVGCRSIVAVRINISFSF